MAGKTDEEIAETREAAKANLEKMGYEFVNTLFDDEWYSDPTVDKRGMVVWVSLCYLAKSLDMMSRCHAVYFCKGWEQARDCRIRCGNSHPVQENETHEVSNYSECYNAKGGPDGHDALRDCRIEHDAAVAYGLEVIYED